MILQGPALRCRPDPVDQLGPPRRVQMFRIDRRGVHAGEGRLHYPVGQVLLERVERAGRTQPARPGLRQQQALAQQLLRQCRQVGDQAGALDGAAAQRIQNRDMAAPGRRDQAGDTQARIALQPQRIAEIFVQPAQDAVDRLQPAERLQIDPVVAHGQVLAGDQLIAQIARQIGMLEIGFVIGTGGQQYDPGLAARPARPGGRGCGGAGERLAQRPEKTRHALDRLGAERVRQAARQHHTVFQRVAGTGRRLGPVVEHDPAAVGHAAQIEGGQMQLHPVRRLNAMTGPEEARIGEQQRRRQGAVLQDFLRPVEIGQQPVEQAGTLGQAGLDLAPFRRRHDRGQGIERPGPGQALRIAIDIIGDAVLADHPFRELPTRLDRRRRGEVGCFQQCRPGRPRRPAGAAHLVVGTGRNLVSGQETRAHGLGRHSSWCSFAVTRAGADPASGGKTDSPREAVG